MRKILFLFFMLGTGFVTQANPKSEELIRMLNRKFQPVQDYTAQVKMHFSIPGVKMNDLSGKVYYRKPDHFKIKAKGIFFMPKQNPMQYIQSLLLDTASYTTIISGYENFHGKACAILNIIPLQSQSDLVLGKFWITLMDPLLLKSQITTRSNGTLESEHFYDSQTAYGLPSRLKINLEMKKIRMAKMMAADLNKKATPREDQERLEKGNIEIWFNNYRINSKFSQQEMDAEPE